MENDPRAKIAYYFEGSASKRQIPLRSLSMGSIIEFYYSFSLNEGQCKSQQRRKGEFFVVILLKKADY